MKYINTSVLFRWLHWVGVGTILVGLVYISVQQVLRQGANDPQIQIAEEVATAINNGVTPQSVVEQSGVTDIGRSLTTFLSVYDASGTMAASGAILDGEFPAIPTGVFGHAKENGQNRVTWEPEPGVRAAVVIMPFAYPTSETATLGGFIAVGRSLREVEKREAQTGYYALLAWLAIVVFSFAVILAEGFLEERRRGGISETAPSKNAPV